MSKRKTLEQFIAELNDENVEVIGEYVSTHTKVLIRYKDCGHSDMKEPAKLLSGQRCPLCKGKKISKSKTKNTELFMNDLKSNGIDYIEAVGDYKGSNKKMSVLNTNCGHTYEALPYNMLHGSGCPICHGFKDTDVFKGQVEAKYPKQYEVIGEYVNNRVPILVRHKKCGYEWKVIPKDLIRDIRCPKCNLSKGEYYIAKFLQEKHVVFEQQYKFDDCKDKFSLPFDFMIIINGKKKLIEFDGSQHYENTFYHSENVTKHDSIKNIYCNNNGIDLLRIPYWWLRNKRIDRELEKFISE